MTDLELLKTECIFCGVRTATGSCFHPIRLNDGRMVISRAIWQEMMGYKNTLAEIEELITACPACNGPCVGHGRND